MSQPGGRLAVGPLSEAMARIAMTLSARTGGPVVVTIGAGGALVASGDACDHVPGKRVEVVDTTGAGDLFAAGMLYGLTHGMGPVDSTRLGGLCAAEVISHTGARPEADLKALASGAGLLPG